MNDDILIAKFMGSEIYGRGTKCINPKYNDGTISPMQFSTSYDWIMAVIDKIETLGLNLTIDIHWHGTYISSGDTTIISGKGGKNRLENTYIAVVKFIKKFNEDNLVG